MFDDLTIEQLKALLVKLREARILLATGGDVAVVVAEARRMEFTRANAAELYNLIKEIQWQLKRRGGMSSGSAIGVEMRG